jgi:chemosensory pili system protein ChpC
MSTDNLSVNREHKELYSLLIPLKSERLLVPRMCVAEVIAFADTVRDRQDESPDWYLGSVDWNGRRLPVVSFDQAEPDHTRAKRSRARVVVFHAIGEDLKGGYYGILTQGFPSSCESTRTCSPSITSRDYRSATPCYAARG